MKRYLITNFTTAPILVAGGEGTGNLNEASDAEILSRAFTGIVDERLGTAAIADAPFTHEPRIDLNARVMEVVSTRVEQELNEFLMKAKKEGVTLELLTGEVARDTSVGLGWRGFTVFIDNEEIPFAGGSIVLNGDLGITLHYLGRETLVLQTTGELRTTLEGVGREGEVSETPYTLTLNGRNLMDVSGSFTANIRRHKVHSMTADISATIIRSDVTASGRVGERTVEGAVNLMNILYTIVNEDILKHPREYNVVCSGDIEARINGEVVDICMIEPSRVA